MNTASYKVAVVGPEDVISGFRALGATVFNVENGLQAVTSINEARQATLEGTARYAIIMITTSIRDQIAEDDYQRLTRGTLPAIVTIPGLTSDPQAGEAKLRALAEKAIGSNILK